jgi:hypothetical protein
MARTWVLASDSAHVAARDLPLGRGHELLALLAGGTAPTRGCRPPLPSPPATSRKPQAVLRDRPVADEAFARLQAAKRLLAAGHTAKANAQLQQALAFYRQIDAAATSARPTLWPPHRPSRPTA